MEELDRVLVIFEFFGYFVHFILGSYFVWRLKNITLIHANLRIILCFKVTQYFFVAVGRIGDLVNDAVEKPLIVTNLFCLFFKLLHDAGIFISAFCPLWVAAERFCATIMIKTYSERTANVGIWIVGGTHIFCFGLATTLMAYDLNSGLFIVTQSDFSCQFIHLHPNFFPIIWILIGFIFCLSAIILVYLYRYNVLMKTIHLSTNLSARYQYSENVRTLRFLVPAFVGLGSLNLLAVFSLPFIYFADSNVQFLYLIPIGYGVYFVVYVIAKYDAMRKSFLADFSCAEAKIRPQSRCVYDADLYWKHFEQQW
ncbi:hypothetical protein M3Y98_00695000 [Aphelenchoides besseyi]|nr:hypothetical protein M3Y98_00695000 [Aphelenchoides besseyi]KAI6208953.1 hypothetical protein M3Y96_00169400 [Aphelenchoides besseyi]